MLILGIFYALLLTGLAAMLVGGGSIALVTYALGMPAGAIWLRLHRPAQVAPVRTVPDRYAIRQAVYLGIVAGIIPVILIGLMGVTGWADLAPQPVRLSALLLGVLIPQFSVALVEEFTFRATIQPLLMHRFTPQVGLLVASLLFGFFHLPNILFHDVPLSLIPLTLTSLTLMGVAFGQAFIRSGAWLGVPAIMHFTWNTACFGLEDLFDFSYSGPAWLTGSTAWFPESGLLGLAGLALLSILVCVLPYAGGTSQSNHALSSTETRKTRRRCEQTGDDS